MLKFNQVLLIDDDQISNFINEKALKKLNCIKNISSCLNGQQAIDYLKSLSSDGDSSLPEIILLDINMPVMDGIEFLKSFRSSFPNGKSIILVMLTTIVTPQIKEKLLDLNVADFIQKPLDEEKLSIMIQKHFMTNKSSL